MSGFCKECNEYISDFREHTCPPSWQAIRADYDDPNDEESYRKAFGYDAHQAAEDLVNRHFSDWDYPREVEIWVRKDDADKWRKFEVSVEPVPHFTSVELEIEEEE